MHLAEWVVIMRIAGMVIREFKEREGAKKTKPGNLTVVRESRE